MRQRMQWSRLKKMLEARAGDSLRPRLQIHLTRYGSREAASRLWVLLDREPIFSTCDHKGRPEGEDESCWTFKSGRAHSCLYWSSFYGTYGCEVALRDYLNYSIDEALLSPHPLSRALSVFDSRLGKRRLASPQVLAALAGDAPLPRHFYALRCQAEGIAVAEPGPN